MELGLLLYGLAMFGLGALVVLWITMRWASQEEPITLSDHIDVPLPDSRDLAAEFADLRRRAEENALRAQAAGERWASRRTSRMDEP